ncbi:DMT family transporter [Angustibacter speluncae]
MHRSPAAARTGPATAQVVGAVVSLQVGAAVSVGLLERVGAFGTLALRLVVAAVVLVLVTRAWRVLPALRRDAGTRTAVLLLGLAMVALSSTFYLALERLPLGVTVTLELLGPLLLTVLRGRRRRDLVCAGLALVGVALLTGVVGTLDQPLDPLGVVLALAAGGFWALYILASQHAGAVSRDGSALGAATALAALLALPAGVATAGAATLVDPVVLGLGLVVGLLCSAVPYALEMRALRSLRAATFGVLMSLEPAVAALAGFVLLHQPLAALQVAGIAVVVGASALASLPAGRGRRRRTPVTPAA